MSTEPRVDNDHQCFVLGQKLTSVQEDMEAWAGVPLNYQAVYGIRVYRRGSKLENHVDRSGTHIISAIVNIEQKV